MSTFKSSFYSSQAENTTDRQRYYVKVLSSTEPETTEIPFMIMKLATKTGSR